MSIQKLKEKIARAEANHLGGQRLSLREMRDILSEFEIEKQRASELSDTFWGRTCARETKRADAAGAELSALRGAQEPVTMDALRDAVAEMSGGLPMEWRETTDKGHHGVPFINFNSLHRIVSKFTRQPKPVVLHDERDYYQDTDEYEQGYVRGWNASLMEAKAGLKAAGIVVKDGELATITCWSCKKSMNLAQHSSNDGLCPHCNVEIDLDE